MKPMAFGFIRNQIPLPQAGMCGTRGMALATGHIFTKRVASCPQRPIMAGRIWEETP